MCSKGGGSPPVPSSASTAFQSTVSPSPTVAPLYTEFLNRANALSQTPFNPAMQGAVAGMNTPQLLAGGQLWNIGTGEMPAATQYLTQVGRQMGDFDPARVQQIMSPFTEQVVQATQNWFNNQNAIQGNDLLSQAIRSGNAFGGDRAGVAAAQLAGQQQLAQAPVIAGLRQAGYTQALDEYNKLKQFGLAGAQAGVAGTQAGLAASGAALGWGGLLQAQEQRELDVAQQNAMMQSAYPFQTLNWYGSTLGGIGPLLGSFAQGFNTPPDPNSLSTALGLGSTALGLGSSLLGAVGGGGAGAAPAAAPAPAAEPADSLGGFQASRGGIVHPRARGGLVPIVLTRRHGGLVPVAFQFGGSLRERDDEDRGYRRDEDEERPRRSEEPGYDTQDVDVAPQGARRIEVPNIYGQLKVEPRQLPQPVYPTGSTQPQQKSTGEQLLGFGKGLLDLGVKAAPLFAMMSDPKTKTDVQRVGKTDDGEPLYGFRYRGDPKWYPKVVGPMARPGARPGRFQDGGDTDTEVMSDVTPDPILPGQQYARDYAGRTTWFNPRNERGGYTYIDERGQNWTDTGAMRLREGAHASGLPSTTPGIATPGRADLRNWFEVTGPGGVKSYAQKTDIGPAGVVDLNAPLAARMYGRPGAVPSGRTYARDLGPNRPAAADIPVTDMPFVDPEAAGARAGPSDGAGPGVGAGPGGGRAWTIPGRPQPTFAQNVFANPFTQFGASLLAQRSPYFGVNLGQAMLTTQQMQERQRKQDLLDAKPEIFDDGESMKARVGDTIYDTGLPSKAGRQEQHEFKKMEQAHKYRMLEKGDEEKFRTFSTPYGTVTGARQPDGTYVDTETGEVIYDPKNPTRTPAATPAPAQAQPPAQQPAQQQPVPAPGQTTAQPPPAATTTPAPLPAPTTPDRAPSPGTAPAPTTVPRQTQAPAQQAPVAGPAGPADVSGGPLPPATDDQKTIAADLAARGEGFKTPLQVDPRLLRGMGVGPEEFDALALRLAHGDTDILKGLGGSRVGGMARNALRARATQFFIDQGLGPKEANAAVVEYGALKAGARSLATQEGRLTTAIQQVRGTAPVLLDMSAKVPRTQFPTINSLILSGKKQIGDVDVANLEVARRTLIVNYASALGRGNGVLTDFSMKKAEALLEYGYSHNQMANVIQTMQTEMDRELVYLKRGMGIYTGRTQEEPTRTQTQTPATQTQTPQLNPKQQQALDWANANPNDPRAAEIKKRLGVQ